MDYKKIDKMITKYILLIACLIVIIVNFNSVLGGFQMIVNAFSNIIFATMLAYVINIIMTRIENLLSKVNHQVIQKMKRPLSMIFSLIIIVIVIFSLIRLVVPEFMKAVGVLSSALPTYFIELQDFLTRLFVDMPELAKNIQAIQIDWNNLFSNVLSFAGSGIGSVLGTTFNLVSVITNSLFNILLIFIFSLYLLLDKDRFLRLYHRLTKLFLSERNCKILNTSLTVIHQSLSSFIGGQCIEAIILGTLCAIGMIVLRLPYALMIGTLVGTINIIPIIGAYVGGAIGVFMVFTVSPSQAIVFLIYLCILQQIESNLIYPRVVGNSVGLPGVYVLGSVMVFGTLAGIPGMFLGIPIVASIYKLTRMYIESQEKKKSQLEKQKEIETAD